VGAGVDAADEAVPLGLGLVASNAETSPLEAMIAAMTTAMAGNLANRGVFVIGMTLSDISGRVSYNIILFVILYEYVSRHTSTASGSD
jgi:hypothetical protein